MHKRGTDILAFDIAPYTNHYVDHRWFDVGRLDAVSAAERYPDRTLLLCWPEYDETWPTQALAAYAKAGGQTVVYIGEGYGGATADDEFHALLESDWVQVKFVSLPSWFAIHDDLYIYRRRKTRRRKKV